MPSIETEDLWQTALLWESIDVNDDGEPIVNGTPIEIPVRWLHRRTKGTDPDGNLVALDAVAIVDRDIPIYSIMWLGAYSEFVGTGSGSAGMFTELMQVRTFDDAPDLKNRFIRRSVGLIRFKDQLPLS